MLTKDTKLRFWCQKVLPLVYDDSLSYYELLNKVVLHLNMHTEDINALIDFYNSFSGDIEEIIRQMMDDGEFNEIIADTLGSIIAEEYDPTKSYIIFDYCIYDGKLYRANGSTTGTFDPEKWAERTVAYDLTTIQNYIYSLNAGNVAYDPTETYDNDTVGKELKNLNNAIENIGDVSLTNDSTIYDNINTIHLHTPTANSKQDLAQFTLEPDGSLQVRTSTDGGTTWSGWNPAAYKNINRRTNCNIACFGDSWTNGTGIANVADRPTKRFTAIVARKLGMTEYEFADGGERFIGGGIQSEINTANSSMTGNQKINTGIVLIVGGINDYRNLLGTNTSEDFANAVKNCAIRAHEVFPNALIVLGIGNTSLSYFPAQAKKWYYDAIAKCESELFFPHLCLKNLCNVISGRAEYYATLDSGTFHPNDAGHAAFGGYIADAIMGGSQDVKYELDITLASGFSFGTSAGVQTNCKLYRYNDEIILNPFYLDIANPTTSLVTFGNIPEALSTPANMYASIYRANAVAGTCCIVNSGGALYVKTAEEVNGCYMSQLRWQFGKENNADET